MISHALTIIANELDRHITDAYGAISPQVGCGNLSEGVGNIAGGNAVPRDILCLSIVNVKEDKTLKNVSNQVRDDAAFKVFYQNPPVFLNCHILLTATHGNYTNALLMLSRAIRFFQFRNVMTQENIAPASLTTSAPANALDRLERFKFGIDLYSPSMEEVNHLWGTLGGKQYPFVMYLMRLMELKFNATQSEGALITDVVGEFRHKAAG